MTKGVGSGYGSSLRASWMMRRRRPRRGGGRSKPGRGWRRCAPPATTAVPARPAEHVVEPAVRQQEAHEEIGRREEQQDRWGSSDGRW